MRLRPKPYDTLRLFVTNPGRLSTKQELIETICLVYLAAVQRFVQSDIAAGLPER